MQAETKTVRGVLTVAAFPSAARSIRTSAMRRLVRAWQELELRMLEVAWKRAIEPAAADTQTATSWSTSAIPAADRTVVELQEFINEKWLYVTGLVDFLLHALRRYGGPVLGHMVIGYSTRIQMVGAGFGVAQMPSNGTRDAPATVWALAGRSAPLRRGHGVWRRSIGSRPAITAGPDELEHATQVAAVPQIASK